VVFLGATAFAVGSAVAFGVGSVGASLGGTAVAFVVLDFLGFLTVLALVALLVVAGSVCVSLGVSTVAFVVLDFFGFLAVLAFAGFLVALAVASACASLGGVDFAGAFAAAAFCATSCSVMKRLSPRRLRLGGRLLARV